MKYPSLFSFLKKYKSKDSLNTASDTLDTTTDSLDTTSNNETDIINNYSESSENHRDPDSELIQMEYNFRFPKNYKIDQVTNYFFAMLMKFYQNKFNETDYDKFEIFNKLLLLKNDDNIEQLKTHLIQKINNILNKKEKSNLFDKLEKHPKYEWHGWLSLKNDVLKSKSSSSHILIGKGQLQRGRSNSSKIRSKRSRLSSGLSRQDQIK